jgi:hypothetical protein
MELAGFRLVPQRGEARPHLLRRTGHSVRAFPDAEPQHPAAPHLRERATAAEPHACGCGP